MRSALFGISLHTWVLHSAPSGHLFEYFGFVFVALLCILVILHLARPVWGMHVLMLLAQGLAARGAVDIGNQGRLVSVEGCHQLVPIGLHALAVASVRLLATCDLEDAQIGPILRILEVAGC